MTRTRFPIVLFAAAVCISTAAAARAADESDDVRRRHYNLAKDGLALAGYDPVTFFGTPRPQKGDAAVTASHGGVVYRFASPANRDAFLADPARYEPAYGGWCATAMAEGKKVEVDPRNYRVTDGRLFLFYKTAFYDAQNGWKRDEPGNIRKADEFWTRTTAVATPEK